MAKKHKKYNPLDFYGYREQNDFDPKSSGQGGSQQGERDKNQDARISALEKKLKELSAKSASDDSRIEGKADQALQKANQANTKADQAVQKANQAVQTSSQANQKASEALQKANALTDSINQAIAKADQAISKANEALDKANEVSGIANEALDKSTEALGKSDEALSAATEAKEGMESLSGRVDDIEDAVETLSDKVDGVEDRVDDLSDKVDGIEDKVDSLSGRVDDIEDSVEELSDRVDDVENSISALSGSIDAIEDEIVDIWDEVESISGRVDDAFFAVEYNSDNKEIIFKNDKGDVVGTLDATPFIRDGMVDEVYYDSATKELVIVFNTDSGKEEVRISLLDLFNLVAGSGITIDDGNKVSIKLDEDSDDTQKFLSVSEDGLALSGVTEEIEKNAYAFWQKPETGDTDTLTVLKDANGNEVIKISKEGELFLVVEEELMSVNDLLGQLAHESY